MLKLAGSLNRYPARVTSIGFALMIVIGAALLCTPMASSKPDARLTLLDSIFMSTSAVCVTGLSVRSLAHDFSFLGQLIMLMLIQIGGLGIMTLTTFVLLASGNRGGLRHHLVITSTIAGNSKTDLKIVLKRVFYLTAISEATGFVILAIRFLFEFPIGKALWNAMFLSVSSFCNAGFALQDESLIPFRDDPFVMVPISCLIIIGGIGYPVLFDVGASFRRSGRITWDDLHLHSKMVLLTTAGLLVFGAAAIFLLELGNPSFQQHSMFSRFMMAGFQSITCRTAGFNSVDLTLLGNATLIVMMILMLIGGAPCSTAGGMKVTTFMMLLIHAYSRFRGRANVTIFRRTIPQLAIDRATATTMIFISLGVIASVTLLSLEQIGHTKETQRFQFLQIVFEVASSLCTVGLSINQTSELSGASKFVIVILMFVGRLGPISFFSALARSNTKPGIPYAAEEPITG